MLVAAIVRVTPVESGSAPPHTGQAVQGWLLNLIRAHDPRLSMALHEGNGLRPYTVSDVVGLGPLCGGRREVSPDRPGWLRITTLTAEMSEMLTHRIIPMLPGAIIDLDRTFVRVDSVTTDPHDHPWAGAATSESLVMSGSLSSEMSRRLLINFASPTVFKTEGGDMPFPTPRLVFGNLLNHWNSFSSVALHPDTRDFAEAQVVAGSYHLRARYANLGTERGMSVGAVGECHYYVRGSDRYWIGIIRTLAAYAFFAGIGRRTTIGMGQAALWDSAARRPVFTFDIQSL